MGYIVGVGSLVTILVEHTMKICGTVSILVVHVKVAVWVGETVIAHPLTLSTCPVNTWQLHHLRQHLHGHHGRHWHHYHRHHLCIIV